MRDRKDGKAAQEETCALGDIDRFLSSLETSGVLGMDGKDDFRLNLDMSLCDAAGEAWRGRSTEEWPK